MIGRDFTRRAFLKAALGLSAGFALPPPPVQDPRRERTATTTEPRAYFVPLKNYHELPSDCYSDYLIHPLEIILHWDGNNKGRALWLAPVTFETLRYLRHSSHFAVDYKRVWQMLPMYQTLVQESHGAKGYNWEAINVEMAGINFDLPENFPPEGEIRLTVWLVSDLMDFYGVAFEHVVGHFERDARGDKQDPGPQFMAHFRERLKAYRSAIDSQKSEIQ